MPSENENEQVILVVDDAPENIDVLSALLATEYKVKATTDGERALAIARSDAPPDLVLLDVAMPGMDGYEVCRQLKADPRTRRIPVLFVTAKRNIEDETRGFEIGAVDYITKPISPPVVKARVRAHLALYDQNRALEQRVMQRTAELADTRLEIVKRLGRAGEYKDNETGMHVIRMSYYSRLIALGLGMSQSEAELVLHASPMHDIGKIGIPDRILLKPAKLEPYEWEVMKSHSMIGAEIIGEHPTSELLNAAYLVARHHHEKWNGQGYPDGLAGERIPLLARIVALADVFDALTSDRPYKRAWTVEDAVTLMDKERGQHFDPQLVTVFLTVLPEILKIKEAYRDE